jgi:hypothetical protein
MLCSTGRRSFPARPSAMPRRSQGREKLCTADVSTARTAAGTATDANGSSEKPGKTLRWDSNSGFHPANPGLERSPCPRTCPLMMLSHVTRTNPRRDQQSLPTNRVTFGTLLAALIFAGEVANATMPRLAPEPKERSLAACKLWAGHNKVLPRRTWTRSTCGGFERMGPSHIRSPLSALLDDRFHETHPIGCHHSPLVSTGMPQLHLSDHLGRHMIRTMETPD